MGKPLADIYREYIACLNGQDWDNLGRFVHETVSHNGRSFGLAGYRAMLEQDFKAIPDLHFKIDLLVSEARGGFTDHLGAFAKLEIEIGGRAHALSCWLAMTVRAR